MRDLKFNTPLNKTGYDQERIAIPTESANRRGRAARRSPSLTDINLVSEMSRRWRVESPPSGVEEYKRGGRRRSRSGGSLLSGVRGDTSDNLGEPQYQSWYHYMHYTAYSRPTCIFEA